jgi:hypothetical protein
MELHIYMKGWGLVKELMGMVHGLLKWYGELVGDAWFA